ncbi:DUF2752 domain-containing protein [Acinetobacter nosocomialis]|nr:DUF2752 domain-containing protein [Acinetobacter nosocomialis]
MIIELLHGSLSDSFHMHRLWFVALCCCVKC